MFIVAICCVFMQEDGCVGVSNKIMLVLQLLLLHSLFGRAAFTASNVIALAPKAMVTW